MTELNLSEQFPAAAAGNDIDWQLRLQTRSRRELVHLASYLAKALRSDFLQDPEDPPIIMIPGSQGGGKSMIVEAMMKTLLDQTDPLDMLKWGARKKMFIESKPMEASDEYCYAAGTHDEVPVLLGFDRVSTRFKGTLVKEFKKAIADVTPAPARHLRIEWKRLHDTGTWLLIRLHTQPGTFFIGWNREVAISVNSEKLKADPKFRLYWTHLQDIVRSGNLALLNGPLNAPLRPTSMLLESFKNLLF